MSTKTGPRRGTQSHVRPDWNWQDDAQCWGENLVLFFGPEGERQPERDLRERRAKAICSQCPVRAECLGYALSRPEKYGTWGGLNEDERFSERRRRMRGQTARAPKVEEEPEPPKRQTRPALPADPDLDMQLLRESERLIAAGETVPSAAKLMDVSRTRLTDARARARKQLAEVS